jgi:hypothetical protein
MLRESSFCRFFESVACTLVDPVFSTPMCSIHSVTRKTPNSDYRFVAENFHFFLRDIFN